MPEDVIETTAEPVYEPPTVTELEPTRDGAELAMIVVAACGRTPQGNICARPMVPPELLAADRATVRDAILSTIPLMWLEKLPNIQVELDGATEAQLRMLLVMNSSFWCMGRIEGTLEERARHETE